MPTPSPRPIEQGSSRFGWLLAACVSLLATQSLYFEIDLNTLAPAKAAMYVVALAVFIALTLFLPARWAVRSLAGLPRRIAAAIAVGALGLAAILTLALPLEPEPGKSVSIEVEALGQKSPAAAASEVWVRLEVDGQSVSPEIFAHDGKWERHGEEFLVSRPESQPAKLSLKGEFGTSGRLIFVSHPWSGKARISMQGKSRVIDLYSPKSDGYAIAFGAAQAQVNDWTLDQPSRDGLQTWIWICETLVLAFVVLLVFLGLYALPSARQPVAPVGARRIALESLGYAVPTLLTGLALLALFYPGLMSSDSMDQWGQATRGEFHDGHPLLHSFFFVAVRAVWDSVAAVALTQLLLFAGAAGWLIAVVRRATAAPVWAAWAASVLLAVYPMTAITSVTLWKDVPYTAAVVGLSAFLVGAVFLGVPDIKRKRSIVALAVLMFSCMALRHNGPPVAIATLGLMAIARPRAWKQLAAAGVLAVAALMLLKGPVADMVHAKRVNAAFVLYSHHIAAHLAHGHLPADPSDAALLKDINSGGDDWRYNCSSINPTIFNDSFSWAKATPQSSRLLGIWKDLALARPDIEVDHTICSTGMLWRLSGSRPLYLYVTALNKPQNKVRWIVSKPGEPQEDSFAPDLAQRVGSVLIDPDLTDMWRPAGFLYLLCFLTLVAWARSRDVRMLLIPSLAAAHSSVMVIAIIAQDARYQLPVYVVALATAPLLALARKPESATQARTARS
ncbi:hypothetical protein [Pseudomonas sp. CGJS7]|uniref:hypothetical protein n=1 Tax=Pseudomonas sp. CGJS7 TaxID=3109348 RepID=UPI0030085039